MSEWKKVVFVGDAECGKSHLLSAICGEKSLQNADYQPTVFEEKQVVFSAKRRKRGGQKCKVEIPVIELLIC